MIDLYILLTLVTPYRAMLLPYLFPIAYSLLACFVDASISHPLLSMETYTSLHSNSEASGVMPSAYLCQYNCPMGP